MDFYSILSKNIRFNSNFTQIEENVNISNAKKLPRIIILEQMENREILKIKNKRKIKPSIFFQLNENINQEERIRVTKKLLKEKTIKNDFENSIANVNMEDLHEILENYKSRTPLKRIGLPEEVAQSIYFFADYEKSSFITGSSLIVDGGAYSHLSTE